MIKTIKLIKKLEKNKYRNSSVKLIDIKKRLQLQKKILGFRYQKNLTCENYCDICKKFQKYLRNENFFKFYKKFNAHLKIHKYYDKKLKPIKSKKGETCLINYIKLSLRIYKYKNLDKAQKLNTILKINDKILLNVFQKKRISFVQQIKNCFMNEQILIKSFLND